MDLTVSVGVNAFARSSRRSRLTVAAGGAAAACTAAELKGRLKDEPITRVGTIVSRLRGMATSV